jgi:hypothetical protein
MYELPQCGITLKPVQRECCYRQPILLHHKWAGEKNTGKKRKVMPSLFLWSHKDGNKEVIVMLALIFKKDMVISVCPGISSMSRPMGQP